MRTHTSHLHISDSPCVVALGCFDGVHKGHRAVILAAKERARSLGLGLTVFTFAQPPKNFFAPLSVPVITDVAHKLSLLDQLGVDETVCVPLGEQIFSVSAESFVTDILLGRLKARHVVCGYNYTFGANGAGTPELIRRVCASRDIGVDVVPEYALDGTPVSSSIIRETVENGDVARAALLLGRPFSLISTVVDGQHLARRLGFPTVNTVPERGLLLPKRGVYVTAIRFDGEKRYGITNVGVRPTVDTNILCAETHIFDFNGDLYGKEITVEFLHFLRDEVKFDSVDAMAEQVRRDIESAKEYIKGQE